MPDAINRTINRFQATIVVAVARNGVIGLNNTLPWKLSSDLQRFKRLTMGHALIMGRKTYESIGRPLPGRTTIVLSRTARELQTAYDFSQSQTAMSQPRKEPDTLAKPVSKLLFSESFESALALLPEGIHPFVVGGSQIYELTLPLVNRIWLTRVIADVPGDAYMPRWQKDKIEGAWPPGDWKLTSQETVPVGPKDEWPTRFEEWVVNPVASTN
jgi:dihydrofolate reductase